MSSGAPEHEDLVDMIAESLIPGRKDTLRQLFNSQGARAPMVIWSPGFQEMHSPLLRRFATVCETMMDDVGHVPKHGFDLAAFEEGMRRWIMVVAPDGDNYRYEYYGKGIARHYGRDMTGQTTTGFTNHIGQFFNALYQVAQKHGEWVLSEHEPPKSVFVRVWRRLIVPLFGTDSQTVTGFAVINLPDNELRTGLELMVDPVFVMDGDQVVHYANGAAQRLFGLEPIASQKRLLSELSGITLDALPAPEDMLTRGSVEETVQLTIKAGIAERLVTTISAAEQRGTAFYVVVLRMIGT